MSDKPQEVDLNIREEEVIDVFQAAAEDHSSHTAKNQHTRVALEAIVNRVLKDSRTPVRDLIATIRASREEVVSVGAMAHAMEQALAASLPKAEFVAERLKAAQIRGERDSLDGALAALWTADDTMLHGAGQQLVEFLLQDKVGDRSVIVLARLLSIVSSIRRLKMLGYTEEP